MKKFSRKSFCMVLMAVNFASRTSVALALPNCDVETPEHPVYSYPNPSVTWPLINLSGVTQEAMSLLKSSPTCNVGNTGATATQLCGTPRALNNPNGSCFLVQSAWIDRIKIALQVAIDGQNDGNDAHQRLTYQNETLYYHPGNDSVSGSFSLASLGEQRGEVCKKPTPDCSSPMTSWNLVQLVTPKQLGDYLDWINMIWGQGPGSTPYESTILAKQWMSQFPADQPIAELQQANTDGTARNLFVQNHPWVSNLLYLCDQRSPSDPTFAEACPHQFACKRVKQVIADNSVTCPSEDYTVYERPAYGCFDPSTPILMGDKQWKTIDSIQKGDFVWNPARQKPSLVKAVLAGPEKVELVELFINGKNLKVSQTHPMIIRDVDSKNDVGFKHTSLDYKSSVNSELRPRVIKAINLSGKEEILADDGMYHRIDALRHVAPSKDQIVINLVLDGPTSDLADHSLVANGIVTGDYQTQILLSK